MKAAFLALYAVSQPMGSRWAGLNTCPP